MHFTYQSATSGSRDLMQGDILRRTDEVESVLKAVHPHYYLNTNNKYFIVLTQSCDLVRRSTAGCAARYITIAAVKPFQTIIRREVNEQKSLQIDTDRPICTDRSRSRLQQFLERVLNNNEPDYFFLRKEPAQEFPDDCCAVLRLSIALMAREHYEKCVAARILTLTDEFRAKLGWLVGNIYSRVGTQDWQSAEMASFIENILRESAVWLDERTLKQMPDLISQWLQDNPGASLDISTVRSLASKVPKKKDQVLDRLSALLQRLELAKDERQLTRALNAIRSDSELSSLLR